MIWISDQVVPLPGHRAKRLDEQMPPSRIGWIAGRVQHLEHRQRGGTEVAL